MPMMAITTSSSTSVKPKPTGVFELVRRRIETYQPFNVAGNDGSGATERPVHQGAQAPSTTALAHRSQIPNCSQLGSHQTDQWSPFRSKAVRHQVAHY